MTGVKKALYRFWSSFGLPAWGQDTVPETAVLPYITFDTVSGDAMGSTILSGTVWLYDAAEIDADAHRAVILDQIAEAVPHTGLRLDTEDGGFIMLYRNSGNFQRNVQDPEDRKVVGGRTTLEVHFYKF